MVKYLGNGITFPIAYSGDLKASGIAFPVIGLILLILRALVGVSKRIKPGLSEVFAVVSWLMIVGMGVIFVWSTENGGLGWPTPTDGPQLTKTYISRFQWNVVLSEYLFLILMSVALGTTKLSLLFFFRRLFVTGLHNVWNRVSIVLIAIVAMFTLAFSLGYVFVCGSNPSAFWSPNNVRATQCLPITGGLAMFEKASFITDFILDVACILLPFPIVLGLHLPLRSKLTVVAVFMVGIMTVVASIVRLVIWVQILDTANDKPHDVNLAVTLALQWGMIEAGLAFVVSQLPALGAYLNKASRNDMAKTIKYAASVISLKSSGSGGSTRNHSWTDGVIESYPGTENHELQGVQSKDGLGIRREDVYEVTAHSVRSGKEGRVLGI